MFHHLIAGALSFGVDHNRAMRVQDEQRAAYLQSQRLSGSIQALPKRVAPFSVFVASQCDGCGGFGVVNGCECTYCGRPKGG